MQPFVLPIHGPRLDAAELSPSMSSAASAASITSSESPLSAMSSVSDAPLIEASVEAMGREGREQAARLARQLVDGIDLRVAPGSMAAGVDRFAIDGDAAQLPDVLRASTLRQLDAEPAPLCPSSRLRALIAAIGQTLVNAAHCGVRNLASVGGPTIVRQAVGRAIDVALEHSVSEAARTLLSCACLAVPVVGQAVLLIRDEARGEATRYSRATRVVLMALPAGAGLLGAATGTLLNAGMRFSEVVLYPLLRDSVQARWPMITSPDSGPTRTSLALAGLGYAINQLAVSRAFAAAPDLDASAQVLLPGGLALRGLANWGGEALDLWTLLMLHHMCRHGTGTQPAMRIGQGSLRQALSAPGHWDTMAARGCFVAGFNQLYDSLLDDRTLARWLRSAVGEAAAPRAADWLTELIAGALTAPSYLFWTDPLHARGIELQTLEAQRRGAAPPRQFAGNGREPALAGGAAVELTAYRARRDAEAADEADGHPHRE
jgi:hypothetical protein